MEPDLLQNQEIELESEFPEMTIIENVDGQEKTELSGLSKLGYSLLKEERIADAVQCFNKILKLDSNNNYALVGMGDASRKRGDFQDAVHYYQKCLSIYPDNNYALFGLANCFKALNQYNKAIEIWEQYLLHDSKNITVLTRVADAYRKVGNFKHSKVIYLKVLEMEEHNPYAIIGLGHLHYDFKEYQEALFYWEKMFNLNNDVDIRVLTSIGNCHRKLKTFENGIMYFEKALQRDPYNFYALFGLADCYRRRQQADKSLIYWNKILEQDPRNKVILTRAGDAHRSLENYELATMYYEKALNIEFDTYAVLGLAIIAKIQGRYDTAIESLRRLVQQDSKNYRLYLELADCFFKKNEKNKALEVLEDMQKQNLKNPQVTEFIEKFNAK